MRCSGAPGLPRCFAAKHAVLIALLGERCSVLPCCYLCSFFDCQCVQAWPGQVAVEPLFDPTAQHMVCHTSACIMSTAWRQAEGCLPMQQSQPAPRRSRRWTGWQAAHCSRPLQAQLQVISLESRWHNQPLIVAVAG